MQSYKVYTYRLRIFLVATILCLVAAQTSFALENEGHGGELEAVDSLFARWNKDRSKMPFITHEIKDVTDRSEQKKAFKLIEKHGIGVLEISGGDLELTSTWITKVKQDAKTPPVFVARFSDFFLLPFNSSKLFPGKEEIEILVSDSLVYQLGLHHGTMLRDAGFEVVHFEELPTQYSLHELSKVELYLAGLKRSGLFFSLGAGAEQVGYWVDWKHVVYWRDSFGGRLHQHLKARKEFRKKTGFVGLFVDEFDHNRPLTKKHNQFSEGVGLFRELINSPGLPLEGEKGAFSKADVKKAVKYFYVVWRKIKSRPFRKPYALPHEDLLVAMKSETIVLLRDKLGLVPIGNLSGLQVVTVTDNELVEQLTDYYKVATHWGAGVMDQDIKEIISALGDNVLIVADLALFRDSLRYNNLLELQKSYPVIGIYQGSIDDLAGFEGFNSLIWSPSLAHEEQLMLAQAAYGANQIAGQMPGYFSSSDDRVGLKRKGLTRLKYHDLNLESISLERLGKIDSIVYRAIKNEEIPGCQIMMVKDGQVVYNKNFGYQTYDSVLHIQWDHLYDIASVTKTTATVPLVIKAVEANRMALKGTIGDYLPALRSSDKATIDVEHILKHESGLLSYYPFWARAHLDTISQSYLYKERRKGWRKAYNYHKIHWEDTVNSWLSDVRFNRLQNPDGSFRYLYSDIGFMVLKQMVESTMGDRMDQLADSLIYQPLGMNFTTYNPLNKFMPVRLVPTEDDYSFRSRLLRGQVHDKNAALLGGVSGHAGLFANANDLAKYMYLMLKNGNYGGQSYFDSSLVQKFTEKPEKSHRRGLGWDKPSYSVSNASRHASMKSFGHSGFTGTLVWADPEHDLIYIFLSNRIHPDPQNNKLIRSNTRSRIHDVMYESILSIENVAQRDL